MTCTQCNTDINANFCPACGQPATLKRIDGHYLMHEIEHVLHVERGIFYTIKALLTNPGPTVRQYLSTDRSRLVKPIIFIIITSLVYSLSIHFFHIDVRYVNFDGGHLTTPVKMFTWIEAHYGYANIIMGLFIACWLKVFFRKQPYNLVEILVLLCFVMGIGMLIYALFAVLQGLTHAKLTLIGGMVGLGYCSWAIGHFFGKGKILPVAKAFFAYALGVLSFVVSAIVSGFFIDFLTGH